MSVGSTAFDLDLVRSLLSLAQRLLPDVPTYIRDYLSDHVRAAGPEGWELLAQHLEVLARLDPLAVSVDAVRTDFGVTPMPLVIAALVSSRSLISSRPAENRYGLSQIALARLTGDLTTSGRQEDTEWRAAWSVRRALLTQQSPHIELRAGRVGIRSVTAYVEPNGAPRLAVGDTLGTVRIWDPFTGTVLASMHGHQQSVRASVILTKPNEQLLVTVGEDGTIKVWDLARRTIRHSAAVHAPIWALQRVDDETVITGSYDGSVRLWSVADPPGDPTSRGGLSEIGALPVPEDASGAGRVDALAVNGPWVMVGRHDGRLELWDRASFDPESRNDAIALHTRVSGGVRALTTTTLDGGIIRFYVGYSDGQIWSWDVDEQAPRRFIDGSLSTRTLSVSSLADGTIALIVGDKHYVVVCDGVGGNEIARLNGHTRDVRCSSFFEGPHGSLLFATGSEDGGVRCWMKWQNQPVRGTGQLPAVHVVESRDSRGMVVAGGPETPLFALLPPNYDDRPSRPLLDGHVAELAEMRGIPGDNVIVSVGGRSVLFWDLANEREVLSIPYAQGGQVMAVCSASGGSMVVTGDDRGSLVTWKLADRDNPSATLVERLVLPAGAVAITPTSMGGQERILVATTDGAVHSADPLNLANGLVEWAYAGPSVPVTALAGYAPLDGAPLVAIARSPVRQHASGEHRPPPVVRRSELLLTNPTRETTIEIVSHAGVVRALTFVLAASGRPLLASGDGDGKIVLSEVETGDLVVAIETCVPVLALAGVAHGLAVGTSEGLLIIDVEALGPEQLPAGPANTELTI